MVRVRFSESQLIIQVYHICLCSKLLKSMKDIFSRHYFLQILKDKGDITGAKRLEALLAQKQKASGKNSELPFLEMVKFCGDRSALLLVLLLRVCIDVSFWSSSIFKLIRSTFSFIYFIILIPHALQLRQFVVHPALMRSVCLSNLI